MEKLPFGFALGRLLANEKGQRRSIRELHECTEGVFKMGF